VYFSLFLWLQGALTFGQSQYEPTWASLDKRPIPGWFAEAKFGIFIHWGVYSVPAYRPVGKERYASYAEWYEAEVMHKPGEGKNFHDKNYGSNFEYRQFAPMFKAELFDPTAWANMFEQAGARYVILTSKHHDGFCLWPSSSPYNKGWNALETGPKRDLVGDLTKAVRAKGLKMGLYFSILEWETPTPARDSMPYLPKEVIQKYRIPADRYIDGHILPQLKDLVTRYQPSIIFADGAWDETSDYWKSRDFLAWLYNNAPNKTEVVVNDRWGKDAHQHHGDYYTSEYESDDEKVGVNHPWEESQGMGGSYGLNRAENLDDYKTSAQLIYLLIDRVSRGGNLLLNVGPAADGTIPLLMQERLRDMGQWLKTNGEAIYNTRAWLQGLDRQKTVKGTNDAAKKGSQAPKTVFYTTKNRDLYVLCTQWPEKGLVVNGLSKAPQSVQLLGSEDRLQGKYNQGTFTLALPAGAKGKLGHTQAYCFKLTQVLP
jgi:alpha-L-fucosidase